MIVVQEIFIGINDSGQRLDKFLKKYLPGASAGFIYKGIRKKNIKINGQRTKPSTILAEGDVLQVFFDIENVVEKMSEKAVPETRMDFDIPYQDKNILIANKPPGLLSHPDGGMAETLTEQILFYLYKNGEYDPLDENTFIPAICNRLDRNTGGLVIAAKNFSALQNMNQMIRERSISRYYRLIVKGRVEGDTKISAYLTKDRRANKVIIKEQETEGSEKIDTHISPLKYSQRGYTLAEAKLGTGKTHQIRAQFAYMGWPIIGDAKYGDKDTNYVLRKEFGLRHQFLYGYRLIFERTTPHFAYLKGISVEAPLPTELMRIEKKLFGY